MRCFALSCFVGMVGLGCGPTVQPPSNCPEAPAPKPSIVKEGPVPPVLTGHYELLTLQPKGHDAAPPEAYLLPPEERKKCAFVRIVMSFDREKLAVRYEALCVEPEDRVKNPVPLKWCSTEGVMHIEWGIEAFELPAPSGTRANVQQIESYAPGSGPTDGAPNRTLWGCKFNLDAQRFEIVEATDERVRLRAPKYEAEWVLKPTDRPSVDPDEVVRAVGAAIHAVKPVEAPASPDAEGQPSENSEKQ